MSISREAHYGDSTFHDQVSAAAQLTLRSRLKTIQPAYTGQILFLPNATVLPIGEGGPIFIIRNEGINASICLFNFVGTKIGKIPAESTALVFLKDASTAGGSWVVCTGSLHSGEGWSVGLSSTCDQIGATTPPPPPTTTTTTTTTSTTTTTNTAITPNTTLTITDAGTTIITNEPGGGARFGAGIGGSGSVPSNIGELNPWALPANAEQLFDLNENNAEGDRVSSLIQSDAIAATADQAINRILGLRLDGSSALSTVGGAVRGVAYQRRIEQSTAEQTNDGRF